jgi:AraC-like DNA-binding protein
MIEIRDEKKGVIEIVQEIPADFRKYLLASNLSFAMMATEFSILFQEFRGNGFTAWHSRYWISKPVVLRAAADLPVLELRIALKGMIPGQWERIKNPELPQYYFQMGFVPFIATRAVFAVAEYETFDIHFELSFLQELGIEYNSLELFISKVDRKEVAELSCVSQPCTALMIDSVNTILYNNFSAAGRVRLLHNNVVNILIAALEQVGREEIARLPLSSADIEALHHVKRMIEEHCPEYLSNDLLIRRAQPRLNAFKLSYGFKRLFGINPYDYYLQLRFALGKKLLREGNTVVSVALQLEYDTATTFIREFRKRFGYTPKWFQKYGE